MNSNPAPLWRRFAAMIYDSLILLAISMFYGALTALIYVVTQGDPGKDYQPMMQGPLFQFGWLLSLAGFYVYFWYRGGQTVGMRAWRLRLVSANSSSEDSSAVPLKHCLLRAAIGPFSLIIFGLGYLWAWLDRNGDCLHDKWSGTRVLLLPKK